MGTKHYTLIVVPADHQKPVTRAPFQRRWFGYAGAVVAVLLGIAGYMSWDFHSVAGLAESNARLRLENATLRREIDALQAPTDLATAKADRVVRLDQNLRQIVSRGESQGALAIGPTTGPSENGLGAPDVEGLHQPIIDADPERLASLEPEASELLKRATRFERSLEDLRDYFDAQAEMLEAVPSIWPIRGYVTSNFGSRSDPFTFEPLHHAGLDISGKLGQDVIAPASGVVLFAGVEGGYGNVVVIDHGREIKTRYGHLSKMAVHAGELIHRGELIGNVGTTGHSTGPHLHYEVRLKGSAVDPRKFILDDSML